MFAKIKEKIVPENIIGKGSYSEVYKIESKYVVKLLKETSITPFDLTSEIDILFSLSHDNILNGIGFLTHKNRFGFILPRSEGNLINFLGILSDDEIPFIFNQIVLGLNYLHKNNYLHLDLTCKNVLMSSKKIIKIADFSLSTKMMNNIVYSEESKITVDYRPPENINGISKIYNVKSDVWSLGMILQTLQTRRELIYTIKKFSLNDDDESIDWESSIYDFITEKIREDSWPLVNNSILNKMLTFDREKRCSLDDIIKDLQLETFIETPESNPTINEEENEFVSFYKECLIEEIQFINYHILKICNSMFNRLYGFFEFHEYEKINPNIYSWYKCCYSISHRLFNSVLEEKIAEDDIITLEYHIISFLKGKLTK